MSTTMPGSTIQDLSWVEFSEEQSPPCEMDLREIPCPNEAIATAVRGLLGAR